MSGYPEGTRDFTRLLNPGVGYGVVVGVGAFFAVVMILLVRLQARFTNADPNSANEFASAGRSVKPGLICCGICAAWTWSATLLQSSASTYDNGVSSAFWYGVGGTIQICFFAAIAAKVKMNANGATTFPEIAFKRYGRPCHLLFVFYFLVCAHIVTGSLVLGASASFSTLTGANIYACNFLLPLGIAAYVVAGGLRATFLVDYMHTLILFVVLYLFIFTIYGTSDIVGSPGKLWDLLQNAAILAPVAGNTDGSYTTMKSNGGILFGGCTIASGFSGVFCDQGYWQRAIASRPDSTTRAYLFGGFSWFAIPWAFGSVMGLTARALITNPSFPTFPYALSTDQISAGLVAPAAAVTVLGKSGAIAVLLIIFMAATSACSAELIGVSSIITRDIIGIWRPLSGKKMVRASEIAIVGWAVWAGAWSCILHVGTVEYVALPSTPAVSTGTDSALYLLVAFSPASELCLAASLGWLFYIQGVLLTPAVVPIACTVVWSKQSRHAAFWSTIFGTACGLIGWMLGCMKIYGEINVKNLALPYSAISGSAPGLVMSTLMTVVWSLTFPDKYDFEGTRAIALGEDSDSKIVGNSSSSAVGAEEVDPEKKEIRGEAVPAVEKEEDKLTPAVAKDAALERAVLQKVFRRASWYSGGFALIITILIPIPMFASHYVFSRRFFEVWSGFSIVWVLASGAFCVILPIVESRKEIAILAKSTFRVLMGRTVKEQQLA
ncbi:hypothetical protein JCM11251_007381 [Rhodosporidiobolus azoricus]